MICAKPANFTKCSLELMHTCVVDAISSVHQDVGAVAHTITAGAWK